MSEKRVTAKIQIEGAKLILKNFGGSVSENNRNGERFFGVLLDDELASQLAADGWPVKVLRPRPDDPEQREQPWLKVKVRFDKYPPVAVMIKYNRRMSLDEVTIGQLDWSYLENVDLKISPYNYPAFNGRPAGVTAYLDAIYATIREDPLEMKYADIPEVG